MGRSTKTTDPADSREILEGMRSRSPDEYRTRFATALRLAVVEGAESLEVARSRACVEFARLASGLDLEVAERVRCGVYREEAARRGVLPLNLDPFEGPGPSADLEDDDGGAGGLPVPRVPRGEPVPGARVRLSCSRRR